MKLRLITVLFLVTASTEVLAVTKEVKLQASTTWDGAALRYVPTMCPEVQAVVVKIAKGESTGIHLHTVNNYAYILRGTVHLEAGNVGADKRLSHDASYHQVDYKEGQAFAELVNTWHNGTAGPDGVDILVWYTTATGYPVTASYSPDYKINPEIKGDLPCIPSGAAGAK